MPGKNSLTLRLLAVTATVAAASALMMTGASAALAVSEVSAATHAADTASRQAAPMTPATSYPEYYLNDAYGEYLMDSYLPDNKYGVQMINGDGDEPYFEFRNGSVFQGKDVYELYDPASNECVAWESSTNLFEEAGCKTGSAGEDFWYGDMNDGNYSELYNVGASGTNGPDRCLSAMGTANGSGLAAYLCSDDSEYQVWTRVQEGSS
jgi:hypothetical protein